MALESGLGADGHGGGDWRELGRKYGIVIVLIALWIGLAFASETFRTSQNVVNILRQVSMNGIIAVGMTFAIMTGGIDLSVGSLVAVAGVVGGSILAARPEQIVLAIGAAIFACALFGLFNGFFIAYAKVPPFITTLASMTIARGFAYVYSNGRPYVLKSPDFRELGRGVAPIVVFLAVVAAAHFLLSKTTFGRYVYATGGNIKAALASGVNVRTVLLRVYVLCGLLAGLSGVVLSARTNSGQPAVGIGYELDAIAAVIIGGTSMSGGSGTIIGTLIGTLIIGTLNNGLNLLDVSSYYQMIVKGFIILGAVYFDLRSKTTS